MTVLVDAQFGLRVHARLVVPTARAAYHARLGLREHLA